MARTDADVEGFFNDLDSDDTELLLELVAGMDPLAMEEGKPKYTGEQITLIGRFQQFAADYTVDDEDDDDDYSDVEADEDGLEKEDVDGENSEDIPGTGETETEYAARKAAEGGAGGVTDTYTNTVAADQNTGYGYNQ